MFEGRKIAKSWNKAWRSNLRSHGLSGDPAEWTRPKRLQDDLFMLMCGLPKPSRGQFIPGEDETGKLVVFSDNRSWTLHLRYGRDLTDQLYEGRDVHQACKLALRHYLVVAKLRHELSPSPLQNQRLRERWFNYKGQPGLEIRLAPFPGVPDTWSVFVTRHGCCVHAADGDARAALFTTLLDLAKIAGRCNYLFHKYDDFSMDGAPPWELMPSGGQVAARLRVPEGMGRYELRSVRPNHYGLWFVDQEENEKFIGEGEGQPQMLDVLYKFAYDSASHRDWEQDSEPHPSSSVEERESDSSAEEEESDSFEEEDDTEEDSDSEHDEWEDDNGESDNEEEEEEEEEEEDNAVAQPRKPPFAIRPKDESEIDLQKALREALREAVREHQRAGKTDPASGDYLAASTGLASGTSAGTSAGTRPSAYRLEEQVSHERTNKRERGDYKQLIKSMKRQARRGEEGAKSFGLLLDQIETALDRGSDDITAFKKDLPGEFVRRGYSEYEISTRAFRSACKIVERVAPSLIVPAGRKFTIRLSHLRDGNSSLYD